MEDASSTLQLLLDAKAFDAALTLSKAWSFPLKPVIFSMGKELARLSLASKADTKVCRDLEALLMDG